MHIGRNGIMIQVQWDNLISEWVGRNVREGQYVFISIGLICESEDEILGIHRDETMRRERSFDAVCYEPINLPEVRDKLRGFEKSINFMNATCITIRGNKSYVMCKENANLMSIETKGERMMVWNPVAQEEWVVRWKNVSWSRLKWEKKEGNERKQIEIVEFLQWQQCLIWLTNDNMSDK
ncbi:MAG: hypothetical protein Ta2E_13070 [Mycoplasmoidaceae bacterium]|nr:MAG: hypothetical protein Ta2E_13070 [Mycoplasmoidaceae bacterium]